MRLTNTAPTTGRDQIVLAPNVEFLRAGENRLYVSTYCGPDCALSSFAIDGEPATVAAEREFGMAVFSTSVQLTSGVSQELTFTWRQDATWDGRTFRLVVPGQLVMRPPTIHVTVYPPCGQRLQSGNAQGAARRAAGPGPEPLGAAS